MGDFTNSPTLAVPTDSSMLTYSASIKGLVAASSATDIFEIKGAAGKVVRITRLQVSGRATAAASVDIAVIKRSTANTGGTSTAPAAVPHDSTFGAGTATLKAYTVNPTTGTSIGTLRQQQLFLGDLTTGGPGAAMVLNFGDRPAACPNLRGVLESLCVNLNAETASGNLLDIDVEWTEALN